MSNKKGKKLLEDILPLDIISEVEKWPVLYSRECPERINARFRNKVWEQVAANVLPHWDTYSADEKEIKTIDLAKKWRNLRDAFKRHIEFTRKINDGVNVKKKEYVYFKYMSFLLPHVLPSEESPAEQEAPAPRSRKHKQRRRESDSDDVIDEDKHFLMSLVPSFQKMSEDEKLSVKMDILRTIRTARSKRTRVCEAPHYHYTELHAAADLKTEDLTLEHAVLSSDTD